MKNLIKKIGILVVLSHVIFSSTGTYVFAEEVNFDSFGTTWDNSPTVNNTNNTSNNGITWDNNYNPNTPVDFNQFNNTVWDNPATYSGNQTCVGCNTPVKNTNNTSNNGITWDNNYNPNTPVDFNQFNNTVWDNPATHSGNQTCVGCNSGAQYVAPVYPVSQQQYVQPTYIYPTDNTIYQNRNNTIVCSDGSFPVNGSCNRIITAPVNTIINCPTGSNLINGQCVNNINGQVITNINCPSGSNLINGQCVNNINGNIVTNVVCTTGILQNGQCVNTITPPVTTVTNCPFNTNFVNGICQQIINPPVVVYQTCWNGSVIPATQVCAPEYKVCANGTSVSVNQACYVPPTPIYVPPQVIKFNNVVTSVATQITNTSGRCNAIGLIANNAPSTGWFEYGETANLGRTTASAAIGSQNTAPFSNVLANLKPTTKYYCRAVMQNQYGLVKGEIVSFVTKNAITTYVRPIVTPVKHVTKVPVKKNTITCSDGTTVAVKNQSASTLINQGEKLVALQIEKASGKLVSGDSVTYKVTYKNLTDTRLTGVVIKVTLPQELGFVSTTSGNYDENTRTLILNQDSIDPYTEGMITVTGKVMENAPIGKTLVTNVYAIYTVPGTHTQDEVTAYVIGSVVPVVDVTNKDTGVKHVVGISDGKSFMPNSLIEWLALLAILFIIFILGRSIYASYKEEDATHH